MRFRPEQKGRESLKRLCHRFGIKCAVTRFIGHSSGLVVACSVDDKLDEINF